VTLALHTYEDKEEEISYDITEEGERVEIKKGAKVPEGEEKEVDESVIR